MLISFKWLGRHIDLSGLSPEQIASDLTLSTAEVESVEAFLPHAREIVVGRVLTRGPHPGADRLSLCRVDVGGSEPIPVVCGAANVAEGQTVALALPGTTIPGIGKLEKSKIRGEVSLGMICSEQELGLADKSEGIWVLPGSLRVGSTLADALELGDSVIDIDNKSLTHRPDLWGHRGIARELSAIYRRPLLPLDVAWPAYGLRTNHTHQAREQRLSTLLGFAHRRSQGPAVALVAASAAAGRGSAQPQSAGRRI